ncbi:hypothetical protein J4455_02450 [Candidatus Woesearchaeota archaeon]|nr:hypothetical protein [Candidatus Woesearchaeota archaeon]
MNFAKTTSLLTILAIISLIIVSGCNKEKVNYDNLANCLADKNVKEYGAYWCPNCARQKDMFGSSYNIIYERGVYIECDPKCVKNEKGNLPMACRGMEGQPQLCLDKKVEKYPDWEFPDGTRLIGVQELNNLAEKAGCQI